ncbi:cytidylate kinase family protein [Anaerovibrio sp.]|uniref:cytidylate kinase family protein n=1 Tax=Anaerovibrio sp. TaxID=1872532 RepID=UPI00388F367B
MRERKKTVSELLRRYLLYTLGIILMACGIAVLIKAEMGVAPMVTMPYTIWLIADVFTVGAWIGLFNFAGLLGQLIIRRGRVKKQAMVMQIITALALGIFTDMALNSLAGFNPMSHSGRAVTCFFSSVLMASSLYCCVISSVALLPVDSLLRLLGAIYHKKFSTMRWISDITLSLLSAVLGLIFLGNLGGVREGTVIVAVFTGVILKLLMKYLRWFTYILLPENRVDDISSVIDDDINEKHFVLTVSHEYGSGGHSIARRIAHELNLPYYDSDIIQMAAEDSEFAYKYLEEHGDKVTSNALYSLYEWYTSAYDKDEELTQEQVYKIEAQVIQEIAAKDSCVIVGRLANYVLQNHKNSLHIFITADELDRTKRVMRKEKIDQQRAMEQIKKHAKLRTEHCSKFSDAQYGIGSSYDITIKSSKYGVDRTAAILLQLIKEFRLIQF